MTARPEIVLIAAVARNGVIGRDNALPWRLKGDLAHFKATTVGYPVLMGRKTWESLGRPLPGRRNLVVTRSGDYAASGAETFANPAAALESITTDKVFVIGGAELYRQMLDMADTLVITEVQADVEGDAHFPPVTWADFTETAREHRTADADNDHAFDLVTYRRKRD